MLLLSGAAIAQKQLIILKKNRVVARYNPGDDLVFKTTDSRHVRKSYVNNLADTAVVTARDTVPFYSFDRVYFNQHSFARTLGTTLIIAGAGYFFIDQLNNVVVKGNEFRSEPSINRFAIITVGVGVPLVLLQKKSQRMGYHYRMLTVDPDSPLYYRRQVRGYVSPYIPR